jgi:hypothetical protein
MNKEIPNAIFEITKLYLLPKDVGGLGFRRMHEFNLSFIAKLGWKLLSNADCFWVNQLQKKYIKYGNFVSSPNPSSAS